MDFRSSHRSQPRSGLSWLALLLAAAFPTAAAEFIVGPGHYETLQAAVDAAADPGNLDEQNFIHIREPALFTSARVRVGPEFSQSRQLVIRPDPSVPDLPRVTVVSQNGFEEILLLDGAGHVKVQDLDLIRHTTNAENLMEILNSTEIIVERCRIGSDWTTASLGNWSNLVIGGPRHVVVRNCICFARLPGTLARGIVVSAGSAQSHSTLLYDNLVADHVVQGIEIAAHGDAFVLLRNNIVFNHISLSPEPTAYHSAVAQDVTLVASHNTALAGTDNVELVDGGAQSIAGAANFLRFERHEHIQTFREFEWKTDQGWNQNRNLFRLIFGGLLHNVEADAGVTVTDGAPHLNDVAVLDDWELDPRPTGQPPRSDRGPDQFRVFLLGDIEVLRPEIRPFEGVNMSTSSGEGYEIIAVGPQDDFPDIPAAMSGGDFEMSGEFVSLSMPGSTGMIEPPTLPRSTFFDGSSVARIRFPSHPDYDSRPVMSVEAWVYRQDAQRTEAILSHNQASSFWFGFVGPRLRFYRSGRYYADSTGTVGAQRWTHVAAAYDGIRVEFYIDGRPAGVNLLANAGAQRVEPLDLGGDEQGRAFWGILDEVRLWSVRRTQEDIFRWMFEPLGPQPGLVGLFPSGGPWEAIHGVPGMGGPGAYARNVGVLREPIQIPRALWPMTVDGQVDPESEYLGAAQLMIGYNDGPAASAYLVHDGAAGNGNLYVAVTGLRLPIGRDPAFSWVGVGIDPNGSRSELATPFDLQLRGFLDEAPPLLFRGDGAGGFEYFDNAPGPDVWDVKYQSPEFALPNIEFRIPKSEAWLWRDTNALMIGHFDVARANDNYLALGGTVWNSPATWAIATYVENTAEVPRATFSGYVFNNIHGNGVSGQRIRLEDDQTGSVLATTLTSANGYYRFRDWPVPAGHRLRLQLELCPGCFALDPVISEDDIQPVTHGDLSVQFPAPVDATNRYAAVDFYLRQPVGVVTLDSYDPTNGIPRLRLREDPVKLLPEDVATRVTLRGANFHQDMQVYLYGCDFLDAMQGPQPLLGCQEGVNYFEARIVGLAEDGTWVRVEVPHVPRPVLDSHWGSLWSWVVKDNWVRPDRTRIWTRIGGTLEDHFRLRLPPFPLVSGFQFDNDSFGATWSDFEGVYGDNRFVCVDDVCACGVPDEGYRLWFLAWLGLMAMTDGACNGMSATSLQFYRLELDAEALAMNPDANASGIHFANGFTRRGAPERTIDAGAEPESQCSYNKPVNLAAHIRVNHGIQFTEEYLQVLLDQLVGAGVSIEGDPAFVLECVTNDPSGYVISMVPEIGTGHVVTPYAVLEGVNGDDEPDPGSFKILVYDNNHPEDTDRFIEITPRADRSSYRFPRADDIIDPDTRWEGRWSGQGIYAIPISVFERFSCSHSMPGAGQLLEFIGQFILGGADGYYTDGQGGEWGWRPDGTLVDNLPGARSFTPVGGPNSSTRSVMLFTPLTNPPPAVQINVRSNYYLFHAAYGGRMLQIERRDGVPGDTDQVRVLLETGRVASVRFTPQRQASDFNVRAMLTPAARQRVVFELGGMTLPENSGAEFRVLNETRGLELQNDTGGALQPFITVRWSDGASQSSGSRQFGPLEVPPGAVQQIFIQNWPVTTELRSEIDLDRDGAPEQVQILTANAPSLPAVRATVEGNVLVLTWPRTSFPVYLESATTLVPPVPWAPLAVQLEVIGETMRVALPVTESELFFRLRQ
jgi:hypothetical protein